MKTLGWLAVAAVMVIGGLVEYGGPVRGVAPAGHVAIPPADPGGGEPPAAVRSAMAHLREEVRPGPDGTLVIANGAYRASFSARDGVVYTPRHGGTYEPRLAWRYRARTLATQTATRRLEDVAPAVSATGDHVVDFTRPGLVERYEGERTGVEQIFVLPERPAGGGDVRIAGDVTFDGTIREKDGGLEFDAGGGLPVFTYAKPVAFDAKNAPVPVRVEMSDRTLTLVLDAADLARAQWPVTIDPMLGVTVVEINDTPPSSDVAYDWKRAMYLVVYDVADPYSDDARDIRLRRYYDYGDPVGEAFNIHEGSDPYRDLAPAIACDMHTDRCLVTWSRDGATRRIWALLIEADGTPIGSPFRAGPYFVDGLDSTQEHGGGVVARNFRNHTAAETSFLVTWKEDCAGIWFYKQYARISATGQVLEEGHFPAGQSTSGATAYDPHNDQFLLASADAVSGISIRSLGAASGTKGTTVDLGTIEGLGAGVSLTYDLASRRTLLLWIEYGPPHPDNLSPIYGRFLTTGRAVPLPWGDPFVVRQGHDAYPGQPVAHRGMFFVPYYQMELRQLRTIRLDASGTYLGDEWVATMSGSANVNGRPVFGEHGYQVSTFMYDNRVRLANMGRWYPSYVHGSTGDVSGDGRSDLVVYRPATGKAFVKTGTSIYALVSMFDIGGPGTVPVLLDWDSDHRADLAAFAPATGTWTIRLSSTGEYEYVSHLGRPGDIPVPGDYLGGHSDEVGVFRPATGEWILRSRGAPVPTTVTWGFLGDVPVPADYDGDGRRELCVFRPTTGTWHQAELDLTGKVVTSFGQAGDVPFGGNFVGSGAADRAVFRRGTWYIADGATNATTQLSSGGRIPLTLDWDGDGYLDLAFFQETNGAWGILHGPTYAYDAVVFGTTGDIPAGAP